MPSKRQPSKQRRAAQNRAQREALAARREHASQVGGPPARATSGGSSSSSSGAKAAGDKPRRPGLLAGLTGTGGGAGGAAPARPVRPMGGIGGRIMGDTAGEPGARGVLLSVPLGIVAAVALLAFVKVDVDDRGEQVPFSSNGFRGLFLATREALTGQEVTVRSELGVSAIGSFWVLMAVIPLLVVLGVFFFFRYRRSQSMYWTVTIGMLLIAGTVLLLGRVEYIGSMAALTWASFQIRRAELPAKMAEREAVRSARAAAGGAAAGAAGGAAAAEADADDTYDEDAYEEEAYDEEAYEDEAYEEDDDTEADDTEADDTEAEDAYDEDAYEEEAYDEDAEYEDDEAVDEDDETADAAAGNGAVTGDDAGPDERIVDYDEDILKELESEIDKDEIDEGERGKDKP